MDERISLTHDLVYADKEPDRIGTTQTAGYYS
jgi:hypothetical protein